MAPVSYWRLGERSGTVARDEMGLNHGTYVGSPTLGVNGAVAGDGDTAINTAAAKYVQLATPTFTPTTLFSVAAWASTNATAFGSMISSRTTSSEAMRFDLALYNGTGVAISIGTFADSDRKVQGVAVDNDGLLHFHVGTYDGVTLRLYRDGVPNGTPLATSIVPESTGGTFRIGQDVYERPWIGTIDEAAIFNRALTPYEIRALYDCGMGR